MVLLAEPEASLQPLASHRRRTVIGRVQPRHGRTARRSRADGSALMVDVQARAVLEQSLRLTSCHAAKAGAAQRVRLNEEIQDLPLLRRYLP